MEDMAIDLEEEAGSSDESEVEEIPPTPVKVGRVLGSVG